VLKQAQFWLRSDGGYATKNDAQSAGGRAVEVLAPSPSEPRVKCSLAARPSHIEL